MSYDIQDIVSLWDELGRREVNLDIATEALSRAKKELRIATVQLQKEIGPEEPAFDYHHLGAEEISYADEIESEDCICVSSIMDSCPATKHTYLQKQYPNWGEGNFRCICNGPVMNPHCRATEHTGLRSGVILECTCEKGTVLCHAETHVNSPVEEEDDYGVSCECVALLGICRRTGDHMCICPSKGCKATIHISSEWVH